MTPKPWTLAEPKVSLYDVLATPAPFGAAGETSLTKKTETMDEAEALGDDAQHHG